MKKVRILALLMATMLLASCAVAETADPVVIKIGEKTILLSEAQAYFDSLYLQYGQYYASYGLALTADDVGYIRDEAVDTLAMTAVMDKKIEELGLGEISDEDLAALRVESDLYFDETIASYAEYYELSVEEALEDVEKNYGITADAQYEEAVANIPYSRLYEQVTADATVSDEAIQAEYDQYVNSDKQSYGEDAASYELYTNYYGSQILYIPEGFRMVKHILLEIPAQISADLADFETDIASVQTEIDALNTELYALENVPEETETDESEVVQRTAEEIEADLTAKNEALTKLNEECEALRAEILPELKSVTDEIYEKLEKGDSFDALIEEYGTDPGMASYPEGYMVHKDSVIWDTDFRDGAIALAKIGDVSEPVLTGFGVHIIQYTDDAASGPVEMTEEVRAALTESLLQTVQEEAFYAELEAWMAEYEVETHPELIVLPEIEAAEETEAPEEGAEAPEGEAEAGDEGEDAPEEGSIG